MLYINSKNVDIKALGYYTRIIRKSLDQSFWNNIIIYLKKYF